MQLCLIIKKFMWVFFWDFQNIPFTLFLINIISYIHSKSPNNHSIELCLDGFILIKTTSQLIHSPIINNLSVYAHLVFCLTLSKYFLSSSFSCPSFIVSFTDLKMSLVWCHQGQTKWMATLKLKRKWMATYEKRHQRTKRTMQYEYQCEFFLKF